MEEAVSLSPASSRKRRNVQHVEALYLRDVGKDCTIFEGRLTVHDELWPCWYEPVRTAKGASSGGAEVRLVVEWRRDCRARSRQGRADDEESRDRRGEHVERNGEGP